MFTHVDKTRLLCVYIYRAKPKIKKTEKGCVYFRETALQHVFTFGFGQA